MPRKRNGVDLGLTGSPLSVVQLQSQIHSWTQSWPDDDPAWLQQALQVMYVSVSVWHGQSIA